jgi:hypothetical protein
VKQFFLRASSGFHSWAVAQSRGVDWAAELGSGPMEADQCNAHYGTRGDSNSRVTTASRFSYLPDSGASGPERGSADGNKDPRSLWSLGDRSENACDHRRVVTDVAGGGDRPGSGLPRLLLTQADPRTGTSSLGCFTT